MSGSSTWSAVMAFASFSSSDWTSFRRSSYAAVACAAMDSQDATAPRTRTACQTPRPAKTTATTAITATAIIHACTRRGLRGPDPSGSGDAQPGPRFSAHSGGVIGLPRRPPAS